MTLRQRRWIAAPAGALMALLCVIGGMQAAQAGERGQGPEATSVSTPRDAKSTDGAGIAAWTPNITPLHTENMREFAFRNRTTAQRNALLEDCPEGRACIAVGQGDGLHTVFRLYYCDARTLTNFIDAGAINNNQTDDAVVVFTGPGAIGRHYPDGEVHGFNPYPYDHVDPC